MEQDNIMTSAEVASYLRVNRQTIYKLLKSKALFGFRVGSDWRFYRDVIDQWRIEREQVKPARERQLATLRQNASASVSVKLPKRSGQRRKSIHAAKQAVPRSTS
jgi:excisionase family DNA binding protein